MLSARVSELELTEYWCEADPRLRGGLELPMHTGNGAASSAVIYFEHEPGQHPGRHTDSAEEVVLVHDGEAQVIASDVRMRLGAGALALVPGMVPHDISSDLAARSAPELSRGLRTGCPWPRGRSARAPASAPGRAR
jgi:Cupin domain